MASLDKSEYLVTLVCISVWQKLVGMRSGCNPPCPPRGAHLLHFAAVPTTPFDIMPGSLHLVLPCLALADI